MTRALAILVVGLVGCVERVVPARPPVIPSLVQLAVPPLRFTAAAPGDADPVPVPADAGVTAARTLTDRLAEARVSVLDADRVAAATADMAPDPDDAARARTLGKRMGATVVAFGVVRRYVERKGSGLGVTAPASVAYEIVVYVASDGTVLGTDRFDYTQAPLGENLLDLPAFVEGGGRWRTRAEILERALGESAKRLAHWLGFRPR